jgi:hypothetical protein
LFLAGRKWSEEALEIYQGVLAELDWASAGSWRKMSFRVSPLAG